ncbi:MAG TPA: hypothetical protein VNQ53_16145 [Nocardioides sp.]|nr:hypothetical protein [Nocardioides sp.]
MSLYEELRIEVSRMEAGDPGMDLTDERGVALICLTLERTDLWSRTMSRNALIDTWCAGAVDLFRRAKVEQRDSSYVTELGERVARAQQGPGRGGPDTTIWAASIWAYVAGFLHLEQIPPQPTDAPPEGIVCGGFPPPEPPLPGEGSTPVPPQPVPTVEVAHACGECERQIGDGGTTSPCGCGRSIHLACLAQHREHCAVAKTPPHPPQGREPVAAEPARSRWRKDAMAAAGDGVHVLGRDHRPLKRLHQRGRAPQLVSWRLAGDLEAPGLSPQVGYVELWDQAIALPPIEYLCLAVAYSPDGEIQAIVSAEIAPVLHDDCYLGMFVDGGHTTLYQLLELPDKDAFSAHAASLLGQVLERPPRQT